MSRARLSVVRAPAHHLAEEPDPATREGRLRIFRQGLLERELSARTVEIYCREARNAEFFCEQEGYSLLNVPSIVLGQYVELRPKTHASRNMLRASLRQYWAIFERQNPPLWVVRVPRKPKMICRALTDDEAQRLARLARRRAGKQGLAVLLAMYQGFRREEVCKVRWDDFTPDGWLKVIGKGDLPAKLPVHPVVAEAVAKFEHEDPVWLFPHLSKKNKLPHANPAVIWEWVKKLAAEAGLEGVTPHRLRHTCLAMANDKTGDLRATQDFARHSKVDTTAGYTRTTERRLRSIIDAIDYEHRQVEAEVELTGLLAAKPAWRFETLEDGGFRCWREDAQ